MNLRFRGNDFIVFFSDLKNNDFKNKCDLEKYFRNLFLKIKRKYNIDFSGSYNITVYIDEICGTILDVVRDETEYFDYDDIVDMKISVINDRFIYKVIGDIGYLNDYTLYLYDNNLYVCPKKSDSVIQAELFENCDVLFGDCASSVLSHGLVIDNFI